MKAQDPSIKVGVPVWIDDDGFSHWNTTVLPIVCPHVDFVDVHYYPEEPRRESDAHLLASTKQSAIVMATLRADIARACGPRARRIRVIAGELNSTSRNPGKQTIGLPNALFLADSYMAWLEQGAVSVAWWVLHLGIRTHYNNSPLLYGPAAYGDMGILSNGSSDGVVREPPANTPFPPYYGLRMLTKVGRPGERMIAARSDRRLLAVHAVARHTGDLSVLLVNKDRARKYRVSISLAGGAAITRATAFAYGMTSPSIRPWPTGRAGRMITVIVPPYTLATVVLEHAGPLGE
jgi:hypothetical protein